MNSYSSAMEFRDLVAAIVREEISKQAPQPTYATIHTIDEANSYCLVTFPGESTPVRATFGAFRPRNIGDTVRLEGPPGNRYIADVLGDTSVHADIDTLIARERVLWGSGAPSGSAALNSLYFDVSDTQRVRVWRYDGSWYLANQANVATPMSTCSVRRLGTHNISNATWTQLTLSNMHWDDRPFGVSAQAVSPGITIRETGRWSIEAFVAWASNSSGVRFCTVTHNDGNIAFSVTDRAYDRASHTIVRSIHANAGDTLRVHVWQDSGGTLPLDNGSFGGDTYPRLTANMIYRA